MQLLWLNLLSMVVIQLRPERTTTRPFELLYIPVLLESIIRGQGNMNAPFQYLLSIEWFSMVMVRGFLTQSSSETI